MATFRTLPVALALGLSLLVAACEGLAGGGGGADGAAKTGGTLTVGDIVASTMALVGTSQLAGVFVSDPAEAFDTTGEQYAKQIEAARAKTTTCYTLSRNAATLTLDFGAGCTPPGGAIAVKGKAECTLEIDLTGRFSRAGVLSLKAMAGLWRCPQCRLGACRGA